MSTRPSLIEPEYLSSFQHNMLEITDLDIEIPNITENVLQTKKGEEVIHGTKVIFGAGSGLGKSTLIWNDALHRYLDVPSEFGHSDFAPQSKIEYELTEFVKNSKNRL